jgi:hypothetical protein
MITTTKDNQRIRSPSLAKYIKIVQQAIKKNVHYYGHSFLSSFISHPGSSNLSFLASSDPHSTLSSLTSGSPPHCDWIKSANYDRLCALTVCTGVDSTDSAPTAAATARRDNLTLLVWFIAFPITGHLSLNYIMIST